MPTFIRHAANDSIHGSWTIAILAGVILAGLLGFVARAPTGALWMSRAAEAELAGAEIVPSEPTYVGAKKRGRYEAVKANWKRYRAAAGTNVAHGPSSHGSHSD